MTVLVARSKIDHAQVGQSIGVVQSGTATCPVAALQSSVLTGSGPAVSITGDRCHRCTCSSAHVAGSATRPRLMNAASTMVTISSAGGGRS
jgi:hypothetical protein